MAENDARADWERLRAEVQQAIARFQPKTSEVISTKERNQIRSMLQAVAEFLERHEPKTFKQDV